MNKALECLSARSSDALNISYKYQSNGMIPKCDMKSYREGEAIAYSESYKIMKRELERLRNLYQNGALTLDSFDIPF